MRKKCAVQLHSFIVPPLDPRPLRRGLGGLLTFSKSRVFQNSFNIQERRLMVLTEISTKDKALILELAPGLTFVVGK